MPIYERNSLGSNLRVTANENYSYADMGRIIFESVHNDMLLFNAVLKNDFKESAAIREGTMVSSELTSFREASVKEAWAGLKKKLQKVWEKIKGVFRQVYSKLTVWLVRNGKAFVAMHRKTLATKTGLDDCKIPVYLKQNKKIIEVYSKVTGAATKELDNIKGGASSEATVDGVLGAAIGGATAENFSVKFREAVFTEMKDTTFATVKSNGGSIEKLFDNITARSDAMKELKDAEKKADSSIKEAMSAITKAERAATDADKKADTSTYKTASKNCSVFERALTIGTKAAIKAVRDKIANSRQIIGALVAYSPKRENAIYESMAWFEGADDFATVDDIPADEIKADDVASDPDVEINVSVDGDDNECNK